MTKPDFCTLFDSNYLTRGLALYHSLRLHSPGMHLYVYCFDDESYRILIQLNLPSMIPVSLSEFESPELLAIKPTRTPGEYCWTCTSHTVRDALNRFKLQKVTYVDADLCFYAAPDILLDEFRRSSASILLTEHRYSSKYDQSESSGIYCLQFMTFLADSTGISALDWWSDRTVEWCFNRHENGKFGDQKYLDDWPTRFGRVHLLEHIGGGVAPWNVQQYKVSEGPCVNGIPVVFYHFHNLTWCVDDSFVLDRYRISRKAVDLIYRPYIALLRDCMAQVRTVSPNFGKGCKPLPGKRSLFKSIEHNIKGKYRVIR